MYGKLFYQTRRRWTSQAAGAALPLIVELIRPQSMVDVGCGTGIWLREASQLGVGSVLGLDGPWVSQELLEISAADFRGIDFSAPLQLDQRFDLAMSLEVAEHLPPEAADRFVESLCGLAPVVVFSAAIPGQGGQHHVNEQWPSYWIRRFEARGYRLADVLRPALWEEEAIPYWYRQNLLAFVSEEHAPASVLERLRAQEARTGTFGGADLVHPAHAQRALQYPGLGALVKALPFALVRSTAEGINAAKELGREVNEALSIREAISLFRTHRFLLFLPLLLGVLLGAVTAIGKWADNEPEWSYYQEFVTQPLALSTGPDEKLFGYLPGAKALLAPLVALEPAGFFLFLLASILCVFALFGMLARLILTARLPREQASSRLLWLSACLAGPAYLALQNNQLVTFSVLLTFLAVQLTLKRRQAAGAGFLAAAAFAKTLPLALLPMLALLGRWKAFAYAIAFTLMSSLLLASLTDGLPASLYHHAIWPFQVMEQNPLQVFDGDIPASLENNQSFLAYLTRFAISTGLPNLPSLFFLLAGAAFAALSALTWRARKNTPMLWPLVAAWLAWMVFAAPFGRYYYILFVAPLWVFLGTGAWGKSPTWRNVRWLLPLSAILMAGHNPAFALVSFLTLALGIGYLLMEFRLLRARRPSPRLGPAVPASPLRWRLLAGGAVAGLALLGASHLLAKSDSTSLDEMIVSSYLTTMEEGGQLIVISSDETFEGSILRTKAIGVHGQDNAVILRHLSDNDRKDYYIVSYRHVPRLERLDASRQLRRVAANEIFVVYRESAAPEGRRLG